MLFINVTWTEVLPIVFFISPKPVEGGTGGLIVEHETPIPDDPDSNPDTFSTVSLGVGDLWIPV